MSEGKRIPFEAIELGNAELESAIETFKEKKDVESYSNVVTLICQVNVLTPVQMNEKGQAQPLVIRGNGNVTFLPVYTSNQQITDDVKAPGFIQVPFKSVLKMALNEQVNADGIAVNPQTHKIVLEKELLEQIPN